MPSENSAAITDNRAQIIVARDSVEDVQVRQIEVFLDGERKAELMFGDSVTIWAPPGSHTLRVDNTWNHKDVALDVKPGESLRFRTKSSAGQFSRFLLVAFGAGPIYVSIEAVGLSAPVSP